MILRSEFDLAGRLEIAFGLFAGFQLFILVRYFRLSG